MTKIMLAYYNDLTVLLSTIFNDFGFKIIYIGRPGNKVISYAKKYAPESWCFDTKLMLGQALEGIYKDCDIITIPGAWGKGNVNCFLGYLTKGVMQKKLEDIVKKKIKIWFFNLNPLELMFSGYISAYKNFYELKKYSKIKLTKVKLIKSVILGFQKMKMASIIKEIILKSPDIIEKEKLFDIYEKFIHDMIFKAKNFELSKKIYFETLNKIKKLKREKIKSKLTIGIVGDFAHTLFSFFPFLDIEKFLLMQKVSVNQPLSFYNYYSFLSPLYNKKIRFAAKKIFPQGVSGSDIITILSSLYLKDKVNGIIHIRTFSCTPEEVANEVLISNKDKFPPILSLSCDEHTTEENLKVRIEAFIDLLKMQIKD
ncbi:MAG: hypothetical protein QXW97_02930 [Candidatus Pacearchaeota archaeon]